MGETLIIQDFGPIRKAEFELHDLTIFVGPQASGKSLAAQVLYFLRGIEELLPPATNNDQPVDLVRSALELWLGYDPALLCETGTLLSWQAGAQERQEIRWLDGEITLSPALEQRVRTWWGASGTPKSQIYIPAGRILYSFVPPFAAPQLQLLFSRSRMKAQVLPGYISTFYNVLGSTLESLWHNQEKRRAGQSSLFENSLEMGFFREKAKSITKGDLHYGPGTISLQIGQKIFQSSAISAGQMEIWPFLAIAESLLSMAAPPSRHVYFEEPEAHLHPGAQLKVMEIVAQLVRQKVNWVITTHSPYLLYAINNFLMAQKVLDMKHNLPASISANTALAHDRVAAYRFAPDGYVTNIMDSELGLIDEDELDQVADDLGATFSDLQDELEDSA